MVANRVSAAIIVVVATPADVNERRCCGRKMTRVCLCAPPNLSVSAYASQHQPYARKNNTNIVIVNFKYQIKQNINVLSVNLLNFDWYSLDHLVINNIMMTSEEFYFTVNMMSSCSHFITIFISNVLSVIYVCS